jgi:hypothetical protein
MPLPPVPAQATSEVGQEPPLPRQRATAERRDEAPVRSDAVDPSELRHPEPGRVIETRITPRPRPDVAQFPVPDWSAVPREMPAAAPRVEVRIGRIDVEIAQPSPAPAAPAPRERPRGFDDYARLRSYLQR